MSIGACTTQTPTPGVVVFNLTEFTTLFPEFAAVNGAIAQAMFNIATLNLSNCCSSSVSDPTVRQTLLYLLTAHIIYLFVPGAWNNNEPRNGLVGAITSATQGSVSVSVDFPKTPNSAWFVQTQYGATFWSTTAVLRTMRYTPPPNTCGPNFAPGGGAGGWPNRWPMC